MAKTTDSFVRVQILAQTCHDYADMMQEFTTRVGEIGVKIEDDEIRGEVLEALAQVSTRISETNKKMREAMEGLPEGRHASG